jgi:SAM-dependent methyltransferase
VDQDRSVPRLQIEALEIAEGFINSRVLFSLNELGVHDLLADGPRPLSELASDTNAEADALELLLNAGVALGLLSASEAGYANTQLSARLLVSGGDGYLGSWMRLLSRWSSPFVRLNDSVRTGKPAEDPSLHLGSDPEYTRDFIMAMDDYARLRGSEVVDHLDLSGVSRMLDLGGGSGSYAIQFAQRWPGLSVTIFDLPGVLRIADENRRAAGLEDRVSLSPGDYHEDGIGGPWDLVFLSDVLHQETVEGAEALLRSAHASLAPGGWLVVQGMFLNPGRTSPRWPTLYSLVLLLVNGRGRAYSAAETIDMMRRVGFDDVEHRRMSLLNVNSLVLGLRS